MRATFHALAQTGSPRSPLSGVLALALFFGSAAIVPAQDTPAPAPSVGASPTPAAAKAVRITFLPPPLEGSLSLGIYDATGKLVRVLRREADLNEFEIGTDALSLTWDGKDDAGEPLPPGKYHARGYAVGEVAVEGVGYFFNDWVTDQDSPHLQKIHNLKLVGENELALLVTFAGGETGSAQCDLSGKLSDETETEREDERFLPARSPVRVEEGKLLLQEAEGWKTATWPDLIAPRSAAPGKDGSVWVIDRATPENATLALKQFSGEGAFLRQMSFAADAPEPKVVTASMTSDKIFLLEESATVQRVRGLTLIGTSAASAPAEKAVSDWKVDFEKEIVAHQRFAIVGGEPVVGPDPAALDMVLVQLTANPLEKGGSKMVEVAVGFDDEGSFIKTADGLPLQTVSETSHLQRVLLSSNSEKSIDVFQDDDAVVEQFRVNALDQMMAFDAGEIELK